MTTHAQPLPRAESGRRSPLVPILATPHDAAATVMRLTLAVVMFPHGAQKVFGWFGGHGWSGTMGYLTEQAGLPAIVAVAVILTEFLGSLLLAAGLATRAAALGFIGLMIGAVIVGGHFRHGFFMNWSGQQAGEGFEYHILAIAMAAAVILKGSGALSLDRLLTTRRAAARTVTAHADAPARAVPA